MRALNIEGGGRADSTSLFAAAFIVSVAGFPVTLVGGVKSGSGIAPLTPSLTTYLLTASLGILFVAKFPGRLWFPVTVVVGLIGAALWLLVWPKTGAVASGVIQYFVGLGTWAFGYSASLAFRQRPRALFVFVSSITLTLMLQCFLSAFQLAGIGLPIVGEGLIEGQFNRATGTLGHPGNLGKIAFLLILVLLPVCTAVEVKLRRVAWFGVGLGLVVVGMTLGRANIAAAALLMAIWLILSPSRALSRKFALGVGGVVSLLPFVPAILLRNQADPAGGSRSLLLAESTEFLGNSWLIGTGPNSYVDTVGAQAPVTATGLPVHNAFLLGLAELGLLLAMVLFAFLLLPHVRSLIRRRRTATAADVVLVAALPGILVIAMTGWGLLGSEALLLWFFVIGYLVAGSARPTTRSRHSPRLGKACSAGPSGTVDRSQR